VDLTKEAILEIERLAVAASGADAHVITFEPGRARIYNATTGKLEFVPLPETHIDAVVSSLDDMELVASKLCALGSLWVSSTNATLFVDQFRIGKAVLPLRINPVLVALSRLQKLTPKELHSRLRVDLFDTRITPTDFA